MINLKHVLVAAIPLMLSGELLAERLDVFMIGESKWIEVVESDVHTDICILTPGDSLLDLAREGDTVLAEVNNFDSGRGTRCRSGDTVLVSAAWLDSQTVKYQQYKDAAESKGDLIRRLREKSNAGRGGS